MEENTVKTNEIEEYEQPEVEVEEAPEESSGSGAIVAGIVGGFLAYAVIGGVKKLAAIAQTKWAERKQREAAKKTVVDAEYTEVPEEQEDSGEDAPEDK
ncbi:hypothetical protein [uncultured Muribaculum sp.]|uniref:hypothetical protein n=1 Tax=uncultured Muribaculum sp. TaxID=1918613 RepID=UPI00266B5B96|nr:hypothetical protein [uncultured Muribaculum sp.]